MTANYQDYYNDKLIIVTGGTGALGSAVVAAYAAQRAKVIVADRQPPRTENTVAGTDFQSLDVLDENSVKEFFSRYAEVNTLVNVIGGYAAGDAVADLPLEVLQNQLDLNLKSAFLLTKYAVQAMQTRGGKIVHIASRAAVDNGKNSFAYSMSKQGVLRLVEAVAAETINQNININAVMPSIIDTTANRAAMPNANFDKWPKPNQIANVLLFLTSSDAELISGAAIPVYGKA